MGNPDLRNVILSLVQTWTTFYSAVLKHRCSHAVPMRPVKFPSEAFPLENSVRIVFPRG